MTGAISEVAGVYTSLAKATRKVVERCDAKPVVTSGKWTATEVQGHKVTTACPVSIPAVIREVHRVNITNEITSSCCNRAVDVNGVSSDVAWVAWVSIPSTEHHAR